ncbi:MAG: S8 family serine peptidase, partial [Thermoplasmata archaeon]
MGNDKYGKTILRMATIIIALAMIVPGIALTQGIETDATGIQPDAAGPTAYAWVNFAAPEHANAARDIGANIVSLREYGAYVKVTESQKTYLSQRFEMSDMPERTVVNLPEQGIQFDSLVGYELAAEWRNPNSNEYLVQFVAPTETAWNDGVKAFSGKILREIGDNLVVVKMTENQRANVEKLDYVQWVGVYEPGFKVDKDIPSTGIVKITVEAYGMDDVPGIMDELANLGAFDITDNNFGGAECYIDSTALPTVAGMESVKLVWNLPEMKTLGNVGGRIVQAHDVWVNTVSNLPANIMGQGQILHVQDIGFDNTHRDFTQGPLGNRITFSEASSTSEYHGTHVAGCALGNGYSMEQYLGLTTTNRIYNELATSNDANRPDRMGFAGRAPEATLYYREELTDTEWSLGYTAGARIFTNSWGPSRISNGYDSAADTFMNSNANSLVMFAAGNDGPRTNTVSGGGNGKLGISVGAVENFRPIDFDSSDDYNQLASFSSRGPTADGRLKPDVVEIGTAFYSTKNSAMSEAEVPGLYNENQLIDQNTDGKGDYVSLQGTSMACPAAAGDTILIRDYLVDVKGIAAPHSTLMKALLIHGAEDMGLGYPSFDQGWGRVNVRNSIAPAFPNVLQWYHHASGIGSGSWDASTQLNTVVIDRTVPLKVTLVHWDAVGDPALTYDLDLVVTGPDGTRYEGNAFKESWSTPIRAGFPGDWATCAFPSWVGGGAYDWDTAQDGGDDKNNVEIVRIETPRTGTWNIQVVWKSSTARPFTIAVTGGMAASYDVNSAYNGVVGSNYKVNMNMDMPRIVPERDDFGEAVFKCAPSGSFVVPYWINNGGTTNDAYTLSATLPSGFTLHSYQPTSPVSVSAGSRVHGYARILVGSVANGTYTLALKAQSNNDGAAPIAQSQIKFQVDVVTSKTPPVYEVAASPAHEDAPTFVSWSASGKDYIACAYRQDEQFGDRVYFTLSSDGGREWSPPIPISQRSWNPGYLGITRATTGAYQGRLMIVYNAWNPGGYMDNTADTRCSYIKVHYADPPYTEWTEKDAWALGEGVDAGNSYRTVNVNWVPNADRFYITVEVFGYSGTDLNTATQTLIACVGKSSSNGGATWSSQTRIDAAVGGKFYFFPSTEIDRLGNMVLFYYERDSSDASQDRDATFQYYTGTWSPMWSVWDTTDNLMMPQTTTSEEGVNSNRAYGAYLKGAHTDGDRELYLTWCDNPTSPNPLFETGYGPYGPVMSDHDYGTRFVFDLEHINNYTYVFGHRKASYDPYGQPNMLMVFDNDFTAAPTPTVDYLTLDSFA